MHVCAKSKYTNVHTALAGIAKMVGEGVLVSPSMEGMHKAQALVGTKGMKLPLFITWTDLNVTLNELSHRSYV